MEYSLKKARYLEIFKAINHNKIKYQGPLILQMYGLLNDLNLRRENRYILCNFIDQNSTLFDLKEDIYETNNDVSLNQLFLFAYHKAKVNNLLGSLYNEYINSVNAISNKIDITIN
ncbi:MAG: hypothetical protein EAX89_07775 [Candidatus Lokiarchaeota archaeon]|nr:hypothetical protein [Candidatus Lokiarchaeota archaeon]